MVNKKIKKALLNHTLRKYQIRYEEIKIKLEKKYTPI